MDFRDLFLKEDKEIILPHDFFRLFEYNNRIIFKNRDLKNYES